MESQNQISKQWTGHFEEHNYLLCFAVEIIRNSHWFYISHGGHHRWLSSTGLEGEFSSIQSFGIWSEGIFPCYSRPKQSCMCHEPVVTSASVNGAVFNFSFSQRKSFPSTRLPHPKGYAKSCAACSHLPSRILSVVGDNVPRSLSYLRSLVWVSVVVPFIWVLRFAKQNAFMTER